MFEFITPTCPFATGFYAKYKTFGSVTEFAMSKKSLITEILLNILFQYFKFYYSVITYWTPLIFFL